MIIELLGALILFVAGVAIAMALRHRGSEDGGPVGVAMICFGLL